MADTPKRIPFYAIRLADLLDRPDMALVAECWRCGHAARLDPVALAAARGENESLRWLEPKLRCKACGSRAALFRIEYADEAEQGTKKPPARQPGGS
ncbi:MAG TPA: hypothetical protein VF194_06260 [Ferrovibrio sp.]|uniref:hypothetical protein n=1 Tax=Ferrovibrio sp. TaxID=1917215 RepID=UPI002ED0320A